MKNAKIQTYGKPGYNGLFWYAGLLTLLFDESGGEEGISMVNTEYDFKSFLIPKMFLVSNSKLLYLSTYGN